MRAGRLEWHTWGVLMLIAGVLAFGRIGWAQPAPAATSPASAPSTQAGAAKDEAVSNTAYWIDKLAKGGKTVIVQILLSVVGLAVALERLVRFRRSAVIPSGLADQAKRLLAQHDYTGAAAVARRHPSTLGRMIESMVAHRDAPKEERTVAAADTASRELRLHLHKAYPLAVVATLEPLLGLLGTIFGMIGAFDTVAAMGEMGNASALADDIAKALVTTAVGLVIAIPALWLYHHFKSRTTLFGIQLEEAAGDLLSEMRPATQPESSHAH